MDCWDGSFGEPIITHGYALTSNLLFKDVLEAAIKPFAFQSSDYPLILSIENHCSKVQQDKMASYLQDILGDMLFKEPVDKSLGYLPSPESFKNKILIKDKKVQLAETGDIIEVGIDEEDYVEVKIPKADVKGTDDVDGMSIKISTLNKSQALSDLVNYIEAVKFKGFEKERNFWQMSSFPESKAFSLLGDFDSADAFVKFNKTNLSRVYPGGSRIYSSNPGNENF